MGPTIT